MEKTFSQIIDDLSLVETRIWEAENKANKEISKRKTFFVSNENHERKMRQIKEIRELLSLEIKRIQSSFNLQEIKEEINSEIKNNKKEIEIVLGTQDNFHCPYCGVKLERLERDVKDEALKLLKEQFAIIY